MLGRAASLLVLIAAALTSPVAHAAASSPEPLTVREVAPGVHVHVAPVEAWRAGQEDVANLGFIVGERCVAVIDTGGSPGIGERWLATIRQVTRVPVCHVISTHVHPDHLLGHAAFAALEPRPGFIGHARLPPSLAQRGPYYLRSLADGRMALAPSTLVAPDRVVDDTLELDLGGRTLTVRAWPTSHTDNDLTVHDSRTGTLFLGDLLFASHLPVIDGSLLGWLATMDRLATVPAERVVPGHGEPSAQWPGALAAQRRYLEHVRDATREAIRSRVTLRQAVERIGPGPDDGWQLQSAYHRRNLTAAYAELEWE